MAKKASAKPSMTASRVSGAVPYRPRMKKAEVLATIEGTSGRPSLLRGLRATSPAARTRRYAPAATAQETAPRRSRRRAEVSAEAEAAQATDVATGDAAAT